MLAWGVFGTGACLFCPWIFHQRANLMISSSSSFAILGAGLMGRLLAVTLAQRGHTIHLYEAQDASGQGSAARVAAAMLAPLAESAITEPGVVRMGEYALNRWPQLLAGLPQPVFFQQNGTLVVWHRQDAPEAARLRRLFETTSRTVASLPAMQALDSAGMAALEPALAQRFHQGLYLPGEGQLDNRQLLTALEQAMHTLPVQYHWNSPQAPSHFQPGSNGQPDWVLDCRGLGAQTQWPALRGVRGEVLRVYAPDVTLQRPTRLVHPRYPIYIAPKQDHLFVIGATEIESDDMSPASMRSALELMSAAYAVHPGFAEARILEIATQCRPTLPDNLPAVRQTAPRVLEINGLYRHGFMIAPALLDVVLELLGTGQSALAPRFDLHLELLSSATA